MLQLQLNDWNRVVLTGLVTIALTSAAVGQPSRLNSRDLDRRTTADFLDETDRKNPGYDRRPSGTLQDPPEVDLSGVNRRALENLLTEAVNDAGRLYRALQQDVRNSPELRSVAGDVNKLESWAGYLVQDLRSGQSLEQMLPAIRQLDSDWRLLSHKLGQAPRISRASLEIVDRIDRLGRQIEKMFELDPQLDRRSLANEFAQLDLTILNLIRELEYEERAIAGITNLIYDCRKVSQHARRIKDMVLDGAEYELVVEEYNRFGNLWSDVETNMAKLDNRRIRQSLRDIAEIESKVHELLWLEKSTDRDQLQQTAHALIRDVDEFFTRTPLKLLLHLNNADRVLKTADDFYTSVESFEKCIERKQNTQELLECYRHVEEDGIQFVRAFQPLKSKTGQVVLREIEDGIASLRAELNLSGSMTSVDVRAMMATAASLEGLADHLDFDVKRWLARERPGYREDAQKSMSQFVLRSRRFHRMLQSRPTAQELRRETADLYDAWTNIRTYLNRCRTDDRAHMVQLARGIATALYDLQSPLDLQVSRN